MKLKLYIVHADTDNGAWIQVFTDATKEQEFCQKIIRKSNIDEAKDLLKKGKFDEAWMTYQEECSAGNDYYFRHEKEVELPEAFDELLAAGIDLWNTSARTSHAAGRLQLAVNEVREITEV